MSDQSASEPGGRLITVVGSTATGKSALAVELAQRLDAEVINADSMQLYTGMDIGTAKITTAERRGVPHHLLDVWPLDKSAAVAQYQQMARECIAQIHGRGRIPILVGGSGLYVRGTVDHIDFPGESETIRVRLRQELTDVGSLAMHRRLAMIDPAAAAAILPSNGRRIVRALEVVELTGKPFLASMPAFSSPYDLIQIGLERADLDERVERRTNQMMEQGFLNEVRALLPSGLRDSPTAGKALGYAQLLNCVDDDGVVTGDIAEAVAITIRATRRFVRRQRSWFRRDNRIHWLDAADVDLISQALRVTGG